MTNDYHVINADVYREMLIMGASLLEKNKALVDSLNVFPVPDGDTGSNMSMTMNAAVKELLSANTETIEEVAQVAARGALRGARGNSGVILSQLFRGMAKGFEGVEQADAQQFANALAEGSKAAYKAVMRPKEGTILTVARYVADAAESDAEEGANVYIIIDNMLTNGEKALAKTPEQLSVLKEAGVVDSGGKGLMFIYYGFKMSLDGDSIEDYQYTGVQDVQADDKPYDSEAAHIVDSLDEIEFAYCTEFFIEHLNNTVTTEKADRFRDHLQRLGDSVVVVSDTDLIKVHVHTNVPGKILQMALRLGELNGVKIDNMKEQHRKLMEERKANEKEYGLVAVSSGEGIDRIFQDLNVDALVKGGQTMNPSAQDIEKAVRSVNARNVFVFPNNKNIVLAAQQAKDIVEGATTKKVTVVPTVSIQQGVAALLALEPESSVEKNVEAFEQAAKEVLSGAVTKAVRSTQINGLSIQEGDYMAMLDGQIIFSGKELPVTLDALMERMMTDDGEYVTVFYGNEVSQEDASAFAERLRETYEDADVVLQYGGQPLYEYYISVE